MQDTLVIGHLQVEALKANINRIVLGSSSSSILCLLILEGQFYQVCLIAFFPLPVKKELKHMGFTGGEVVKNLPASSGDSRDMGSVPGLGRSPEVGNGTHSSILAWKILWTEEPGGLQSMGLQRVGHD